jgi:hypothetical protein
LGDCLWLAKKPISDINADGEIDLADDTFPVRTVWTNVGPQPNVKPGARKVLGPDTLHKPGPGIPASHIWVLAMDVPVFEGYYNEWTDVLEKQSGLDKPTVILTGERNVPEGITLSTSLKIQVVGID